MKDTFIIRTEWYEAISELDAVDKATIFSNLFAYHSGQDIILDTPLVRVVWKLIEPTLERNIETYDRRRETSAENGALGGRPEGKNIITDINGTPIPSKQDGKHYFYIIYDQDLDIYKIGETQDIKARRLSIKRPTKFLKVISFFNMGNQLAASDFERSIIIKFKDKRVKGDWLDLSSDDLQIIKELAKNIQTKAANNPNYPNETLSDSVYVYDNDSVYDSVIVSDIDSEIKKEKISVEISAPEKVKSFKQFTEQDLRDEIRRHRASFALQDSDLLEFFKYWTEKSASGRMRFQMERTWDTGGRLGTWQARKKEFSKGSKEQQQHDALTGAAFSYLNTLTS
jgi:hypothetical protein